MDRKGKLVSSIFLLSILFIGASCVKDQDRHMEDQPSLLPSPAPVTQRTTAVETEAVVPIQAPNANQPVIPAQPIEPVIEESEEEDDQPAPTVACKDTDWECSSFSECSSDGQQTRTCTLTKTDCERSNEVKPVESIECIPPESAEESEPGVVNISMTAKQWDFSPSVIEVSKGDRVNLSITSIDVSHGFSLSAFGISELLEPNTTVEVSFVADREGTYTFFCSVFCGSGHSSMKGSLIVK